MARPRLKPVATNADLEEAGLKADALSNMRSDNGYIKLNMTTLGARKMRDQMERTIEERQRELDNLRRQHVKMEDTTDRVIFTEKKKKKKDKKGGKNKKGKKHKNNGMSEASLILKSAIEEYRNKFIKKDKKDKGSEYAGVTSKAKKQATPLTEEEKQKRQEAKAQEQFEKRFEEPLALIRLGINDMDDTMKDINTLIQETKESRARNKHLVHKDLLTSKIGLLNSRISAAKSMADIQRIRMDIESKKAKETAQNGDDKTRNIAMMNKFFPQLIASGAMSAGPGTSKSDTDEKGKNKDSGKKNGKPKKRHRADEVEGKLERRMAKLIDDGEINLTPHELAIDMEGKYRPAIMRSFKNPDDWKVIAIDPSTDSIIKDFKDKYPGVLPKKKELDLRFDDEKDVARCRRTDVLFTVIQVPHLY